MLTLLFIADPAALAAGLGEALRGAILAGTCFGVAMAAAAVAVHREIVRGSSEDRPGGQP
jgi:hypothetical protein